MTSARVGLAFSIMDSSIWVATMTGLNFCLARSINWLWATGTCSGLSSTPRSPLATMMPSAASRIASASSRASGFSIFAIMFVLAPASLTIDLRSLMSAARRTKDNARKSTPSFRANCASSRSFFVREGAETLTPGRLIPLLFFRMPP